MEEVWKQILYSTIHWLSFPPFHRDSHSFVYITKKDDIRPPHRWTNINSNRPTVATTISEFVWRWWIPNSLSSRLKHRILSWLILPPSVEGHECGHQTGVAKDQRNLFWAGMKPHSWTHHGGGKARQHLQWLPGRIDSRWEISVNSTTSLNKSCTQIIQRPLATMRHWRTTVRKTHEGLWGWGLLLI